MLLNYYYYDAKIIKESRSTSGCHYDSHGERHLKHVDYFMLCFCVLCSFLHVLRCVLHAFVLYFCMCCVLFLYCVVL